MGWIAETYVVGDWVNTSEGASVTIDYIVGDTRRCHLEYSQKGNTMNHATAQQIARRLIAKQAADKLAADTAADRKEMQQVTVSASKRTRKIRDKSKERSPLAQTNYKGMQVGRIMNPIWKG